MAESIDITKAAIQKKPLYTPPLEEVANVLSEGLSSNFDTVSVSVAECPDLTQPPYNLTSPGIAGNPALVEVGGVPYLMPLVKREKMYDLVKIVKFLGRCPAFIAGAGAGPWPHIGVNCEGIVDMTIRNDSVVQGTRIVSVDPVGAEKGKSGYKLRRLPSNETRVALLGNCFVSDGMPGKVIKVVASKRVGESNFITSIRETLKKHYGDNIVGLGGAFLLRQGKAKYHVMPDFSKNPINTDAEVDNWLHYYEMRAPMIHVGTLVTGDPDLDLRVQHFHGWGSHGDGGHYHYDTTPEDVQYEGYFSLANEVIRVDRPTETHGVGRD